VFASSLINSLGARGIIYYQDCSNNNLGNKLRLT